MTMGERIKQLRKENGMTQTELAEKLNVTKGTVSTWETNRRMPGFDTLEEMCTLFDRKLSYLMGESDDPRSPALTEEEQELLGIWAVEDDLTEYALKYARLDPYGRAAVEALIREEYDRCREMNTLFSAKEFSGGIRINREHTDS